MTTLDFSALTTSAVWTDAAITQDTSTLFDTARSDATGGAGTGAIRCHATLYSRGFFKGLTWGNQIRAKVRPQGVGGFAVTDDAFGPALIIETAGADRWKGIYWICINNYQRITRVDSQTNEISTGNTALGLGTALTISATSEYEIGIDTLTGVITAYVDGVAVETVTDATYTTGLAAGYHLSNDNHGGTGLNRLVGTSATTGASATGSGAAIETGSDTAAGTGTVAVHGGGSATESGSDSATGTGFYNPSNKLIQFSIRAAFVQSGVDSLGHALTGTPLDGDQVLLPTDDGASNLITWELDGSNHPSLRIASMAGSGDANNLPWKYYNGTTWLSGVFATRGASVAGISGTGAAIESGSDSAAGTGKVAVTGVGSATEIGADIAAGGSGRFGSGAATEIGSDTASGTGTVSSVDQTLPDITIAVVVAGSVHTFTATATDNIGVTGVQFYLNGQPADAAITQAPWQWLWSVAGQLDGNYNVTAEARDAANNRRLSNTIQVNVSNGILPAQGAPFARGGRATYELKNAAWHQVTE